MKAPEAANPKMAGVTVPEFRLKEPLLLMLPARTMAGLAGSPGGAGSWHETLVITMLPPERCTVA